MSIRSYWHSLTGKEVIHFLRQFLNLVSGSIVLVRDRHPIHKRKAVQEFLATHKRWHMFYFPVAAPELKLAAFVWTQTAESTAGTAPDHVKELQKNIFSAPARIRASQERLRACLFGSRLDWFN